MKTAEATDDLIGNKIAGAIAKSYDDKITKVLMNSPQNTLETNLIETEAIGIEDKILKKRYISSDKRLQVIDDLKLDIYI